PDGAVALGQRGDLVLTRDIYISPAGRPVLDPPESTEFKAPKGAPVGSYVSPLWPPPGDARAAHQCAPGGPCDCAPVDSTWAGRPIRAAELPDNVVTLRVRGGEE